MTIGGQSGRWPLIPWVGWGRFRRLRAALNDDHAEVVLAAADALYLLRDAAAYEGYQVPLKGRRKTGQGVLESQVKTLRNPKAVAKICFEEGIGFIPFARLGYKVTQKIVGDNDPSAVRAAAASRLSGDPTLTAGALASFCADKSWLVRAAVVNGIAERDDPALLSVLIPFVDDDSEAVKYEAAAAVVRLSERRVAFQGQQVSGSVDRRER